MARAVGADTAAGVATCRAVPVRTCEAGVQACRHDVAVQTLTLTLTLARRPRAVRAGGCRAGGSLYHMGEVVGQGQQGDGPQVAPQDAAQGIHGERASAGGLEHKEARARAERL